MSDEKSGGAWFSTSLKSNWVVNKHQWRKATPPVDVFSWHTIMGGLLGYATQVDRMNPLFDISREVDRLPKNAAMHRKLAGAFAGAWIAYHLACWYERHYFGKFKYCLDYALERKDKFPVRRAPLFSDPEVLYHWKPIR